VAGIVVTGAAVIALSFTGITSASAATTPAGRVAFAGSVPKWATTANDSGATAATETVEGELYLPLRNAAAAASLATNVSTPGSAQYRKTVTPAQWIAAFSPTQADTNEAIAYLKAQKLTITAIPASRLYIVFRGTAAQLGAAFSTQIHNYKHDGTTLVGPTSAPSVPASLSGKVSGVSVDTSRLTSRPTSIKKDTIDSAPANSLRSFAKSAAPAATVPVIPCSNYAGEKTVTLPPAYGKTVFDTDICGYVPSQLRSAYGIAPLTKAGITGAGQTVAIVDAYASPSIVQDVNTYASQVGDPGLTSATYQQIVPTKAQFSDQEACGYPSGWQGEQTLDVEAVHGIAPGAKILYVGGFNCGGGIDIAVSKILDGKLANIVSNSYGYVGEDLPLDAIQGEVNIQMQAAAEGIGLYFSSGDYGDEVASLGYAAPDFAASSPWVTAVGGTSIGITKAGTIAYETGWGSSRDQIVASSTGKLSYASPLPGAFLFGAGGGTSGIFDQPDYQRGVVPYALAKGNRVSPDISAIADPFTGLSVGIRPIVDDTTLAVGAFERDSYGGTSLASPITAAQIALVQQGTKQVIGFANPTLYAIYKAQPSVFRDVLPIVPKKALAYTSASTGNDYLVTLDTDTSLTTTKGYDDVTGLGGVSFPMLTRLAQGK
jgi:subtilase family serine protease